MGKQIAIVIFILLITGLLGMYYILPKEVKVEPSYTKEQFAAAIEQFQQVCAKAKGQIYFETNSLGVVTVGCLDRAKIDGMAM
jgi:hypothetical protein